jgi:hypothetical protein
MYSNVLLSTAAAAANAFRLSTAANEAREKRGAIADELVQKLTMDPLRRHVSLKYVFLLASPC